MKRQPERVPTFMGAILEKIDISNDMPILFSNRDISRSDVPMASALVKQGLVSQSPASHALCIECDSPAKINRTGKNGSQLSAQCQFCGCIFRPNKDDLQQFRITWEGFANWVASLGGLDVPETISPHCYFLGHHNHENKRFEIYLVRMSKNQESANIAYSAIGQSMTNAGVILVLTEQAIRTQNQRLSIQSLQECLCYKDGTFFISWPEAVFSQKDQIKQQAGLARINADPAQKKKEKLKSFILQKITGEFSEKYHPTIKAEILNKYPQHVEYQDKDKKPQTLSSQMILDAIKEVMQENGLDDWISGKKHNS